MEVNLVNTTIKIIIPNRFLLHKTKDIQEIKVHYCKKDAAADYYVREYSLLTMVLNYKLIIQG